MPMRELTVDLELIEANVLDSRLLAVEYRPGLPAALSRLRSWRVGAVDVATTVRPLHDPRHSDRGDVNGGCLR
jgi:hypothetical protein